MRTGDAPAPLANNERQVGENIASGQGSPDKAMQGWLARGIAQIS